MRVRKGIRTRKLPAVSKEKMGGQSSLMKELVPVDGDSGDHAVVGDMKDPVLGFKSENEAGKHAEGLDVEDNQLNIAEIGEGGDAVLIKEVGAEGKFLLNNDMGGGQAGRSKFVGVGGDNLSPGIGGYKVPW